MNGKIVYYNPYGDTEWMESMTEVFEVRDWDALLKLTKAVLYVKDTPIFSVLFNGGIYDEKNEVWVVEETFFPKEVTKDMRFDEYDFDYEVRNGYMLLDPKHAEDGQIAVKLGDEIHEVGCFYGYMAPAYKMYDDRVEDCGWIGLDGNYIRRWYETHKKHAQLESKR